MTARVIRLERWNRTSGNDTAKIIFAAQNNDWICSKESETRDAGFSVWLTDDGSISLFRNDPVEHL
jgi:hypothetical protein